MEFREIRASLRRHWLIALVVLLLIPVVATLYLVRRDVVRPPARFTTSVDVLIPARDETGAPPPDVPPVLLQGQNELALARETKLDAYQNAELDPEAVEKVALDGRLDETGSLMRLSVAAPTPELAATVIDGYITAYEDGRRASVLEAALDIKEIERRVIGVLERKIVDVEGGLRFLGVPLADRVLDGDPVFTPPGTPTEGVLLAYERNTLLNEIQRRQVNFGIQSTRVEIPAAFTTVVQRRSTARVTPPPPSPLVPLAAIVLGGLLLMVAIPVARDRFDSTITEARAVPGALRAGLLGTIPFMPKRLHRGLAPAGSQWELAFRTLAATSISTDRLPRAIMVTSPADSTQDTVAANLAAALAGMGATVALVGTVARQDWFLDDAVAQEAVDEKPELTRRLPGPALATGGPAEAPRSPGGGATFPELLGDGLAGRLGGDLRPRLARRDIENLYVVPPGSEGVELPLDGLPPLLEALAQSEIDVTIIAGPALLVDPNATIIAWSTRHVLWAIEIGHVEKSDAQLAADRLELAGVEPFGIALVNRSALRS